MLCRRVPPCRGGILCALLFATVSASRAGDPLDAVPPNAGVFAHLRVADVWKTPLVGEVRKALGKDLEKALESFEKELGVPPTILETATFFFPTMPQGPGDETTFIVIVTTNKPYNRDQLLAGLRKKDAKITNDKVELQDRFVLHFASDHSFAVMHETLVEKFAKPPVRDEKPGVMSEALKLARARHQFVFSIDFSKLPNEIFTAAPPELQPFLPLLKAKSTVLFGDVREKGIELALNFSTESADTGVDAERSFKLLMTLATEGLAELLKNKTFQNESAVFLPALKSLERGLKDIQIRRDGARLENRLALKADFPVGDLARSIIQKYTQETNNVVASGNLRQISLAMHNYHDVHKGLPPAAICDKKGKPLLSWRVSILPYIEENDLYKQFKLDEPWDSEHNKKLIAKMPKIYALPGTKPEGKTHYRVFTGASAVFDFIQSAKLTEIQDGSSNTLMIVQTVDGTEWTKPDDIEFDPKLPIEKLLRFVNDKTTVAFCDGSVRMLKKGLPEKTWRLLIQRNDGETIPDLDD